MPRKRMIDPEFWSDEEIGNWSFPARLFYIGLWNFADDEGRFKAHNSLLRSQIFPYDTKISIDKLKKELNHKIQWYEVEGLQYGFIRNFLKYQRIDKPTPSKLPSHPIAIDERSENNQGGLPPNIKEVKLKEEKRREVVELAQRLFVFWQEKMKKPKSKFSPDRKNKILARLKDGYSEEDCKKAIENVGNSTYHTEHGYTSIELIFRNCEKLEGYRDLQPQQKKEETQGDPEERRAKTEWDKLTEQEHLAWIEKARKTHDPETKITVNQLAFYLFKRELRKERME